MTAPDERAFQTDVAKAAFRLGEREGRWRLVNITWPYALIGVTANDGREYILRFNAEGYPQSPPTAGPWDVERNTILAFESWPQSRGGRVASVFRTNWKAGSALYLPCDRESIRGHDNWVNEMPSKIWDTAKGIVLYVELVHELLNSADYVPPLRTTA